MCNLRQVKNILTILPELESSMEIIFQSSDAFSEAKVQAVFPQ